MAEKDIFESLLYDRRICGVGFSELNLGLQQLSDLGSVTHYLTFLIAHNIGQASLDPAGLRLSRDYDDRPVRPSNHARNLCVCVFPEILFLH